MTPGLIFLAGKELSFTIKNLSISGILAQISCNQDTQGSDEIVNALSSASAIDLFIPDIRFACEAEVIRVNLHGNEVQFALEFKSVFTNVNDETCRRKAYRKNMTGTGHILLNEDYLEFNAVNVSVDGMMLRLPNIINVAPRTSTYLEFKKLGLAGTATVVWVDHSAKGGTAMAVRFSKSIRDVMKAKVPEFFHAE